MGMTYKKWLVVRQNKYNELVNNEIYSIYEQASQEVFNIHKKIMEKLNVLSWEEGGKVL